MDRRIFKSHRDRIRFILVFVLFGLIMFVAYMIVGLFTDALSSPTAMKEFLLGLGPYSPPVFIAIQVLQVLIAPIPGQAAGFVSGYVYGAFLGTLYTMIGTVLGSLLAFFLARKLGRPFVEKAIDKEALKKFDYVSKEDGLFALFILFLLPVFPDDAICYIAGLTRIPIWKLVVVASIGRFPGFLILNLAGAGLADSNSTFAFVLFGVMMALSVLLFIFKGRLEKAFHNLAHRMHGKGDGA